MATINSLRLVSPKYQWIVRPGPSSNSGVSPKRLADGEEKPDDGLGGSTMEVVELKDIEKELVLTQARLKLVKFSSSTELSLPVAPGLSPAETVALPSTALVSSACGEFHALAGKTLHYDQHGSRQIEGLADEHPVPEQVGRR